MSNNASDKTRASLLALVMHGLFILLIFFGVSWQKQPSSPVEAELWSKLPPAAKSAQLPVVTPPPQPAPEPPPQPAPPPPKVTPPPKVIPPPPPPPKVAPAPVPKPDIVVKQKIEKKVEKIEKVEPKPDLRQREAERVARLQKEAEAKARREAREQQMQRQLAEKEAKAAADKVAAERAAAERAARAAAARDDQKYIDGIYGKVWARVAVPPDMQGNPQAVFIVSLLPGGELLSVTMSKGSGNAAYDVAIERAIRQAQPFVVPTGDTFHRSFRRFVMEFRPR